ncbi:MAG: lactate utilization protein [Methanobrevibacter sp. CfCl-M3]
MDSDEIKIMNRSFKTLLEKRKNLIKDPRIKKLKEKVKSIREKAIENNSKLLEEAKKSLKENDIDFFLAENDEQAKDIIYTIIKEENENVVAKSKSNTLREIAISDFLKSKNIDIVETDLGDRILQLKENDNEPTHPTGPASHLNVEHIVNIVNLALDVNIKADPCEIMKIVRKDVLERISKSNIGLSGANAVASQDGSIVLIHNEGNISLISQMKTHIIVVGIDKLIETVEDAISIVKLETVYATGSKITSYINVISGPSKTADIEKKLLKNMYGAEKVVVIFLDNGRSEAMESIKEALYCIGCGSCLVTCPVYKVIANEFGFNSYLGGRGVAMSRFIKNMGVGVDSGLYKCALCGLCTLNCPVDITTNEILESIRKTSPAFKTHKEIKEKIVENGSPY